MEKEENNSEKKVIEDAKEKDVKEENIQEKYNKEEVIQEKDVEQKKKKEKSNKKIIIPIIIAGTIFICFIAVFSIIFALIDIGNNKILNKINIEGIDVSKLSKEEAMEKIQEVVEKQISEDIVLKHKDYETIINGKQFNGKFDIEKAVNEAYNVGKDSNIIVNNYRILATRIWGTSIQMPMYYDQEALKNKIQDISAKIPGAVKQNSYYIEDKKLIIKRGSTGLQIEIEKLKDSIIKYIEEYNHEQTIIEIPLIMTAPDEINLEEIRNEIYKEPQDAYVSKNPTQVHPHIDGVDFNISLEEAAKLILEDKEEYEIPLKITPPSKTIKDLGEEAFPDELATYSTRYDASNYNRSNNLTIAASKINGTVVMPGEIFSYNKVVGARTIEEGYREAGAYAGGKVIQSVGGGICQISSTLYNTALLANLEIVDRSNHQFQTAYVPASRDATVSWGSVDFKFKNNRSYPIKIESYAKNGVAEVTFYGIKEETEYEVVIQSKVLSYIPFSVKYVEDNKIEEGKEEIEEYGHNGCTSEAYRILKLNGEVVSQTLLSKDIYDPMQRVVRKGVKKIEKPVTEPTPKPSIPETKPTNIEPEEVVNPTTP